MTAQGVEVGGVLGGGVGLNLEEFVHVAFFVRGEVEFRHFSGDGRRVAGELDEVITVQRGVVVKADGNVAKICLDNKLFRHVINI